MPGTGAPLTLACDGSCGPGGGSGAGQQLLAFYGRGRPFGGAAFESGDRHKGDAVPTAAATLDSRSQPQQGRTGPSAAPLGVTPMSACAAAPGLNRFERRGPLWALITRRARGAAAGSSSALLRVLRASQGGGGVLPAGPFAWPAALCCVWTGRRSAPRTPRPCGGCDGAGLDVALVYYGGPPASGRRRVY